MAGEYWFSKLFSFGALIARIPWIAWNPADPDSGSIIIASMVGWQYYFNMAILAIFLVLCSIEWFAEIQHG